MAESKCWRLVGRVVLGLALGGMLIAAGCSSQPPSPPSFALQPTTYTVRRGDTLYRISQRYGVSVSRLMAANRLTGVGELSVGEVLTIPGSYSQASLGSSFGDYSSEHPTRIFAWPVAQGVLSSGFGMRQGTMHDGVDIAAPIGTPIHAAEGGTVIYSGRLRGYGNVIIIRHDGHYVTVYGHDAVNLVREGESVTRGETIGKLGETGHATGANLHFEVRRDNLARNPLAYLPPPAQTAGISFARNTSP